MMGATAPQHLTPAALGDPIEQTQVGALIGRWGAKQSFRSLAATEDSLMPAGITPSWLTQFIASQLDQLHISTACSITEL